MKYHKINSVFKRDENGKFTSEYSTKEFELLSGIKWVATEKINGTNIRIYKNGKISGRADNAEIPAFLPPVLEKIRDELKKSNLPDDTCLIGEGYGKKIQRGGHYLPDTNAFCLFDANIGGNWQPRQNVNDIAEKLSVNAVPVLGCETLLTWIDNIKSGMFKDSVLHPGARNEGYVLRPEIELNDRRGHRIITKLKFKDFV